MQRQFIVTHHSTRSKFRKHTHVYAHSTPIQNTQPFSWWRYISSDSLRATLLYPSLTHPFAIAHLIPLPITRYVSLQTLDYAPASLLHPLTHVKSLIKSIFSFVKLTHHFSHSPNLSIIPHSHYSDEPPITQPVTLLTSAITRALYDPHAFPCFDLYFPSLTCVLSRPHPMLYVPLTIPSHPTLQPHFCPATQ